MPHYSHGPGRPCRPNASGSCRCTGSRCSILSEARSVCPLSNKVAFMRVAIVPGAARGIGAAIAHRLAADGLAVSVVDLDAQGSARTANAIIEDGGSAVAIGADVADEEAAANAVQQTAAELGPVTVLINSRAIIRHNLTSKRAMSAGVAV